MTREKALKVSRALDAIDMFEALADKLEQVIDEFGDVPDIGSFKWKLEDLIGKELELRNAVLEEL